MNFLMRTYYKYKDEGLLLSIFVFVSGVTALLYELLIYLFG